MQSLHRVQSGAYLLLIDETGRPVAALREGRDRLWWSTLLERGFETIGPFDARSKAVAATRMKLEGGAQ